MNNKGFTLIELIMVIALLAVIALLTTPNIIKLIEKNKVDNYNNAIDTIIKATEVYVSNNKYNLDFSGQYCKPSDKSDKNISAIIELNDLIENKDISGEVKNHCTDSNIDNKTEIKIILNCGTRQFSYEIIGNDSLKTKDINKGLEGFKITSCDELY